MARSFAIRPPISDTWKSRLALTAGLRQLGIERPELVFLAADVLRPDYSALVRTIKLRSPDSFLITLEARGSSGCFPPARAQRGPDLTLPSLFTEKELLDGIFLAELKQTSPAPAELDRTGSLPFPPPRNFFRNCSSRCINCRSRSGSATGSCWSSIWI